MSNSRLDLYLNGVLEEQINGLVECSKKACPRFVDLIFCYTFVAIDRLFDRFVEAACHIVSSQSQDIPGFEKLTTPYAFAGWDPGPQVAINKVLVCPSGV